MPDNSSDNSAILALPYILPGQAQKHVTHNEALRRLDVLVQLRVAGFGAQTPPATPAEGEIHALGAAPTGAWAGQAGMLAAWLDGAWDFIAPAPGWRAWDLAAAELRLWDGAAWILPPVELDNLDGVGIGTGSDATNRLAVKSPASLLTHDGAGHQLKINKKTAGDTASLLFQSGWTGHAEMGLGGGIDFAIKVSQDGATWTEALALDAASGTIGGAAVQSAPDDAAPGRLMPVGAFGLGETGTAPVLADLDATGTPAGLYRMTAATLNRPGGTGKGVVAIRRFDGDSFLQVVSFETGDTTRRYCAGGSFTGWAAQYDTGNVVGPVGEAGGTPTGAVIERGSTADGDYVRFADGTQICTNADAPITAAPAAFTGPVTKIDGDKLWLGRWF